MRRRRPRPRPARRERPPRAHAGAGPGGRRPPREPLSRSPRAGTPSPDAPGRPRPRGRPSAHVQRRPQPDAEPLPGTEEPSRPRTGWPSKPSTSSVRRVPDRGGWRVAVPLHGWPGAGGVRDPRVGCAHRGGAPCGGPVAEVCRAAGRRAGDRPRRSTSAARCGRPRSQGRRGIRRGRSVGRPRGRRVFVTHHGLNSTHEAIYHRTPMLSYPFFGDQPYLANRCRDLGLSVPLVDTWRTLERLAPGVSKGAFARCRRAGPRGRGPGTGSPSRAGRRRRGTRASACGGRSPRGWSGGRGG